MTKIVIFYYYYFKAEISDLRHVWSWQTVRRCSQRLICYWHDIFLLDSFLQIHNETVEERKKKREEREEFEINNGYDFANFLLSVRLNVMPFAGLFGWLKRQQQQQQQQKDRYV